MSGRTSPQQLKRELGIVGATVMGLGSIIGTGVFVSIGLAAGIAGPAVILAVVIGALVATCNGLSSAQLAANHAVSGGTYEYGYKYLNPWLGFTAGWMFLLAKTASAATAALGFASYLLSATNLTKHGLLVPTALAAVFVLTGVALAGIRRSNVANIAIVSISLLSLGFFIIAGLPTAIAAGADNLTPFFNGSIATVLQASALMFVAYTGYGRIATLGEEAKAPQTTIPRAMIVTMVVTMLLYCAVAVVGVGSVGAKALSASPQAQAAPLVVAVQNFGIPGETQVLTIGAITAMLGVLLNLLLGLSRVLLAMGRRRDMPQLVAHLNKSGTTPSLAVLIVGLVIAGLVLIGNVKTTWSFSAFSVLIYYAITNLAALRLSVTERLYPKWVAWAGLIACIFLAFWVEQQIWLFGLALIFAGLIWHTAAQRHS
ncbi:MAG: amino acid permease [Chroococcidiopsidaceae cyanobacterium CP_BM_RX_35]|nr:amino acid permease [Chroococcidiopsidaceae cyanobacterium CP_BM_RX_35]